MKSFVRKALAFQEKRLIFQFRKIFDSYVQSNNTINRTFNNSKNFTKTVSNKQNYSKNVRKWNFKTDFCKINESSNKNQPVNKLTRSKKPLKNSYLPNLSRNLPSYFIKNGYFNKTGSTLSFVNFDTYFSKIFISEVFVNTYLDNNNEQYFSYNKTLFEIPDKDLFRNSNGTYTINLKYCRTLIIFSQELGQLNNLHVGQEYLIHNCLSKLFSALVQFRRIDSCFRRLSYEFIEQNRFYDLSKSSWNIVTEIITYSEKSQVNEAIQKYKKLDEALRNYLTFSDNPV